MKREVVITGASGFLGRTICRQLAARGWSIVGLSTDPLRATAASRETVPNMRWLGLASAEAVTEIARVGKVVNLAGAHPFARRWTNAYKETMFASRVTTTRRVVAALAGSLAPDKTLVTVSGMGFYGDCGDEPVKDARPAGRRWFLTDMIASWEAAARQAETSGARVAILRVGLALERDGGALPIIEQNFRRRMGGHAGHGRQFVPWLHNEDCAALFVQALETPTWRGDYVVASPNPVSFAELARAVGERMGRRSWFHPPAAVARLMLGQASAILLESQRAVPERALANGFSFRYPTLGSALGAIYRASAPLHRAREAA
jgi:uncharacterized protein (TIGR01777 family)